MKNILLHLKGRSSSTEFSLHNFLTEVSHSYYSIFYSINHSPIHCNCINLYHAATGSSQALSLVRHPYLISSSQKFGSQWNGAYRAILHLITSSLLLFLDATSLSKLLSSIRAVLVVGCIHSFNSFDLYKNLPRPIPGANKRRGSEYHSITISPD